MRYLKYTYYNTITLTKLQFAYLQVLFSLMCLVFMVKETITANELNFALTCYQQQNILGLDGASVPRYAVIPAHVDCRNLRYFQLPTSNHVTTIISYQLSVLLPSHIWNRKCFYRTGQRDLLAFRCSFHWRPVIRVLNRH